MNPFNFGHDYYSGVFITCLFLAVAHWIHTPRPHRLIAYTIGVSGILLGIAFSGRIDIVVYVAGFAAPGGIAVGLCYLYDWMIGRHERAKIADKADTARTD